MQIEAENRKVLCAATAVNTEVATFLDIKLKPKSRLSTASGKEQAAPAALLTEETAFEKSPGTVLLSRGATPKVSSPQPRFTSEFGMGSAWFHRATGTRKRAGGGEEWGENANYSLATLPPTPQSPWRLHS